MKVVVCGWVAGFPTAGFLWHPVSFALGFRDLGHEVYFLDDSGDDPYCWDPVTGDVDPSGRAGSRFLARELADLGLAGSWVYRHIPTGRHDGMTADQTATVLAEADVLVDVSMTTQMRPEYLQVPVRIGIDTDPVFTQVRIARGDAGLHPDSFTRLFTFGRPPLPAARHEWLPTRQPVPLDRWPVLPPAAEGAPFTSVTTWQAYPPVVFDDVEYGAKDVSLRAVLDLPALSRAPLRLAMGGGTGHQKGAELMRRHGWAVADPTPVTISTAAYRSWVAGSAGEIGVAKHGYVSARSGWFSERTCTYLASGRPAVVQDTGWTDWLPSGSGLLSYRTVQEAAAAIDAVLDDPVPHAAAARRIVEDHFAATAVCADLLTRS
ncbi:MAG TPA: glycosyltransferase [Mycobacteriales bacterium]|nr:glycosyltransferase [Mycobacteriales bacterium]